MQNRKTVILSVAIAIVAMVPGLAWAVGGPFGADPRPPTIGGEAETDAPYGWMDQMHDDMWNNGELPDDFPDDAPDWMNEMHDDMWSGSPTGGSFEWMDQMHEYMWNNGELPEDFPARGGCGMWGGPERSETTPGT
ncbi:MAG: hypothetical protein OEO77_13495 [Acidimicrobiia bacterium]|nr:hypothetical protein [Acidimicrobiia bacterium]